MEAERRFTDYAAHELKTPLAAIKIQTQLLAKNNNKEKEGEYFQDLLNGVDRANHMVSQLLTQVNAKPPYAVAVNLNFIPKTQYANQLLQENDQIEIIAPITGG